MYVKDISDLHSYSAKQQIYTAVFSRFQTRSLSSTSIVSLVFWLLQESKLLFIQLQSPNCLCTDTHSYTYLVDRQARDEEKEKKEK